MIAKPLTPALDVACTVTELAEEVLIIAANAAPPPAPLTVPIDAIDVKLVPEDLDDLGLPPFAPGVPSAKASLVPKAHPDPAGE